MTDKKTVDINTRGTGFADYKNVLDTNVTVNIRNLGSNDIAKEPVPYDDIAIVKEINTDDPIVAGNNVFSILNKSDWDPEDIGLDFVVTSILVIVKSDNTGKLATTTDHYDVFLWSDGTVTTTGKSLTFSGNVSDVFGSVDITYENSKEMYPGNPDGDIYTFIRYKELKKRLISYDQTVFVEFFNSCSTISNPASKQGGISIVISGYTVEKE